MKKIDLGQTITVIANAAVLVGVLLLVYELSQNRQMMQAQVRHDMAQSLVDQLLLLADNRELAEITVESGCAEDTLAECDTPEQFRYDMVITAAFRYWEDVHYQYRLGLYEESEYRAQIENWRNMLAVPRNAELWTRVKPMFSGEFAAQMDELTAK